MALSTAEAEYIIATMTCTRILWIVELMKNYGIHVQLPVTIRCDKTSAINISKNPIQHSRTKHIDIRYHFLKTKVEGGMIKLEFLPTKEQIADIFTKPLPKEQFEDLLSKLGVREIST